MKLVQKLSKKAAGLALALVLGLFVFLNVTGQGDFITSLLQGLWGLLGQERSDFEISANPATVNLGSSGGSQNRSIITLKSVGGFSGNITFGIEHSGIVGDIRLTLDSTQVFLEPNTQVQNTLTLYVNSVVSPGSYNIDVTATADNAVQRVVQVVLIVSA